MMYGGWGQKQELETLNQAPGDSALAFWVGSYHCMELENSESENCYVRTRPENFVSECDYVKTKLLVKYSQIGNYQDPQQTPWLEICRIHKSSGSKRNHIFEKHKSPG